MNEILTYTFDPKRTWRIRMELSEGEAEKTGDIDSFGNHTYIIYIDGERRESKNRKIEFACDENTTLKDVDDRLKGTKGLRLLSVIKWEL